MEHSAIYRKYFLPTMSSHQVKILERSERAYAPAVDLENLHWDADYHSLDCISKECSCKDSTHEKRKYPSLWNRLEKIENRLRVKSA